MATTEQDVSVKADATSKTEPTVKIKSRKDENILDKILRLLSSVRFGIVMLSLVLICCMIGMLIMQKDVDGFEKYYRELTPAQRMIWGYLGWFDIYHVWYFNLLLAITGLNIILASIDRFPTAWAYVAKPKLTASPNFIRAQNLTSEADVGERPKALADRIRSEWYEYFWTSTKRPIVYVVGTYTILAAGVLWYVDATAPLWLTSLLVIGAVTVLGIWILKVFVSPRFVRVSEENDRITIFAQRNVWNRLGAYVVHIALLTTFFGGFLTSRYGIGGMMQIIPGETTDTFMTSEMTLDGPRMGRAAVPFSVECTDLQQKLIRPEGGLEAQNTIDWLSYVKVHEGGQEIPAVVHMNNPFDVKGDSPPRLRLGQGGETQPTSLEMLIHKTLGGYRFFQSQFTPIGNARSIVLSFEPEGGGEARRITIPRNGTMEVDGIGKIEYVDFYPDFQMSQQGPGTVSPDYNNPVAQLLITKPDGSRQGAFAPNARYAEQYYGMQKEAVDKETGQNVLLVNNHRVILRDFEKVALGHTLTIQYDPGRLPVYVGFTLLSIALCMVFFFSHQRVWAVIESDGNKSKVYFGGNTNRNRAAFEPRFNTLVESVIGERSQK